MFALGVALECGLLHPLNSQTEKKKEKVKYKADCNNAFPVWRVSHGRYCRLCGVSLYRHHVNTPSSVSVCGSVIV